jgi:succinate dehydrogenase / fumarate reductase cytochrome b subunit
MSNSQTFYGASVGKKILMAVTGLVLFLFVVGHMAGNLQIFLGEEELNRYANFLHSVPELLWIARIVLLSSLLVHMLAAVQVWWQSRQARPIPYQVRVPIATDYAARTMLWTGPLVLLFVIYHLLHLTVGTLYPELFDETNVYQNVVSGFEIWYIAAVYIAANIALGVHLYHGLWSLFQTLGWSHPRFDRYRRVVAVIGAAAIALGNISIPVAIMAGWVS